MNRLESRAVRAAIAIIVGIPGTLIFGWLALFLAGVATWSIPMLALEAAQGYRRLDWVAQSIGLSLMNLIWGIAGVLGIVAFWLWALWKRPLSPRMRLTICGGLILGAAAILPFLLIYPEGLLWWLGTVGLVSAVAIAGNLCLLTTRWSGP